MQESSKVLRQIVEETILVDNKVELSQEVLTKIDKENGWLQILNEEGKEIYCYQKPEQIQNSYAPGELVAYKKVGTISDYKIYTWFKEINEQKITFIYGIQHTVIFNEFGVFIIIAMFCIATLVVVAFLFGIRVGKPILYILMWIENITKGVYQEPKNKNGELIFWDIKKNQYRKAFFDYKELIYAIKTLCNNLQKSEIEREKLEKSREEWIAGVSHDMKTPLSSVKGYANLLASEQYFFNQSEIHQYSKIISDKATYIEGLIEDLNLTYEINNHALPINLQMTDLVELVRRVVINIVNDKAAKDSLVNLLNQDEIIHYPVDAKWFVRAIENLLFNALHHNNYHVELSIVMKKETSNQIIAPVTIEIKDNGKGMTKEEAKHVFDRYYRGTNTSEKNVKGSGLGTAIAKHLIEANGGKITVESKVNQGTTFRISLPGIN